MLKNKKTVASLVGLFAFVTVFGCGTDVTILEPNDQPPVDDKIDQPDNPDNPSEVIHRPVCNLSGSEGNGWYWEDSKTLILPGDCDQEAQPLCSAIGTPKEGWYLEQQVIAWDICHPTVGISLQDEPCDGVTGLTCYDGLYCQKMTESADFGNQVCKSTGSCQNVDDCQNPANRWNQSSCAGHASCDSNVCNWNCGQTFSWTTIPVVQIESSHPYRDSARDAWLVQRRDATNQIQKMKVHFSRVELVQDTDWIEIYSEKDGQRQLEMVLHGTHQDFWTPEIEGQKAWIVFNTDISGSGWGFQVDQASYYELLPDGACNRSEDCDADNVCVPKAYNCANPNDPFNPCYGECQLGERFSAVDTPVVIPDNDANGIKRTIEIRSNLSCAIDVYMDISISHPFQGDLKLSVFDPSGHEVVLLDHQSNQTKNFNVEGKQIMDSALLNAVNGDWTIQVSDTVRNDMGALDSWTLYLTCH